MDTSPASRKRIKSSSEKKNRDEDGWGGGDGASRCRCRSHEVSWESAHGVQQTVRGVAQTVGKGWWRSCGGARECATRIRGLRSLAHSCYSWTTAERRKPREEAPAASTLHSFSQRRTFTSRDSSMAVAIMATRAPASSLSTPAARTATPVAPSTVVQRYVGRPACHASNPRPGGAAINTLLVERNSQ